MAVVATAWAAACGSRASVDQQGLTPGSGSSLDSAADGATGGRSGSDSSDAGSTPTSVPPSPESGSSASGPPGFSSTSSSSTSSSTASSSGASSSAASTSGSSSSVACTWDSTVRAGTFTEYYFSQGEFDAGNGYYETACGYYGTEPMGPSPSTAWNAVDDVLNMASTSPASNTYFAAIPSNTSGVWPVNDCGACIVMTGSNGTKAIATIIDECPTTGDPAADLNPHCTETNHLDLSTSLFGATMVASGTTNSGGDPSGGSWQFIACPITGDIVVHFNAGYTGDIYIENTVFPVASGTVTPVSNGKAGASQVLVQSQYGYWMASGVNDFVGAALELTDVEGHTVTGTVPSGASSTTTGVSIGVQFPSPGSCPL